MREIKLLKLRLLQGGEQRGRLVPAHHAAGGRGWRGGRAAPAASGAASCAAAAAAAARGAAGAAPAPRPLARGESFSHLIYILFITLLPPPPSSF